MKKISTAFTDKVGIDLPIICGAMYPCSNPELIAAVSENGGIGIVQPISLTYVYGYDFREGLRKIKSLTNKPIGMNALIEKNAKVYEDRMKMWVDIALEEGIRFFVTALGNPKWVVDKVKPLGGTVYHDVTERKWAMKVVDLGIDGLICVNSRAGGHAGKKTPEELYAELSDLKLPLICAGGIGDAEHFKSALDLGYAGVQMGTRFIATEECASHSDYKKAIVNAEEKDIVHTERVTGIPLAVINTPYVQQVGLKVGPLSRILFKHPKTKHWIRTFYNVRSGMQMKRSVLKGLSTKDYWQAGKSVAGVEKVEKVKDILSRFASVVTTQ